MLLMSISNVDHQCPIAGHGELDILVFLKSIYDMHGSSPASNNKQSSVPEIFDVMCNPLDSI